MKRMRRYRRRPRRVRRYRRRRMMRRGKADGNMSLKCNIVTDVTYSSTYGHADCSVNWGGTDTASNSYVRITQSSEYTNFATLFSEYRITGVKMRWQPISTVTSAATSYYQYASLSSRLTVLPSLATPDDEVLGSVDYKTFDPSKPFTRFIRVGKYFAKKNTKWLTVGTSYPSAGTLFRIYVAGYANGSVVGKIVTTYYVKLKGHNL